MLIFDGKSLRGKVKLIETQIRKYMQKRIISKVSVITAIVLFILDVLLNVAAMFPGPILNTFFNGNTVTSISMLYTTALQPQSWIFSIWILIYLFQISWLILACVFAFKKHRYIIPIATYMGFIVATIFNMIWLITNSLNQIVTSFVICVLLFISIGFAAFWAAVYVRRSSDEDLCPRTRVWLQILLINGLFLYAAWALMAVHLSLDVLLVNSGFGIVTSGAVVLIILALFMIAYFLADYFAFRCYGRYVHLVYPTFALALIAIIANYGSTFFSQSGEIYGLLIFDLVLAIILFILKVIYSCKKFGGQHLSSMLKGNGKV